MIRSLPAWSLWLAMFLGVVGAYFATSGILMTGSFAVASPEREAEYMTAQRWWMVVLALSVCATLGAGAILGRRSMARKG